LSGQVAEGCTVHTMVSQRRQLKFDTLRQK